jgi:hypothetical protein
MYLIEEVTVGDRTFKPLVLETKEQLLAALKQGKLKSAKYNLLDEQERMFVELLVFGDYSGEQAMRAMKPALKDYKMAANRMLSNPTVADAIEELSIQKDKKFMAEISSARDLALNKLKYIMATTSDETVAAACAKTILDKAEKIILDGAKKQATDAVDQVRFAIQVDTVNINPREEAAVKKYPISVEIIDDEDEDKPLDRAVGNNGLPFVISYEGVDSYTDSDN